MHMTVRDGMRESTSRAYLKPVRHRRNLEVLTRAHVQHIELDGDRATGISVEVLARTRAIRARKEVILAAGSIASPALLQRSGIGHHAHLQSVGITPTHSCIWLRVLTSHEPFSSAEHTATKLSLYH